MIFSYKETATRKIFTIFGIKIKFKKSRIKNFIKNYFCTNYNKNALICYLLHQYISDKTIYTHSNTMESYIAGEIFGKIGYNVDIINVNEAKTKDEAFFKKYDVIYGKIPPNAFYANKNCIPYNTGMAQKNYNIEAVKRWLEFYLKFRQIPRNSLCDDANIYSLLAKGVISLGNDRVKEAITLDGLEKYQNLKNLNGFYFDVYDINLEAKNFKEAKKNFLWFGSRAAIHKGLDIVIEVFKKRKDITLHICGFNPLKNEDVFYNAYKDALDNKISNIINHGFVDISTQKFKDILDTCSCVVSPSIAEGGAIGILNTICNGALIPMITKQSGLDVENYGFTFDKVNQETVSQMIDKFLNLPEYEIKNLAYLIKTETREKYSMENYKKNLTSIIKDILNE